MGGGGGTVGVWVRTRIWAFLFTVFFFLQKWIIPESKEGGEGEINLSVCVMAAYLHLNRSFLARFRSISGEFSGAMRALARHG